MFLVIIVVVLTTSPGGRVPYLYINVLVCIVYVSVVMTHHRRPLMLEEGMMTECRYQPGGGGIMAVTTVPISVIVILVPCIT